MTPNPTARPFVWGVLLFVGAALLWCPPASGDRTAPRARCVLTVENRTPFRALVHLDGVYWGWVNAQQTFTFKGVPAGNVVAYATTQYAEQFWGPQPLKCVEQASWTLTF